MFVSQSGARLGVHISRPRLLTLLARATCCKLTAISASAGYGKTTLLSEYLRSAGTASVWYRLTPADRDPARLAAGLSARLAGLTSRSPDAARPLAVGDGAVGIVCRGLLRQMAKMGGRPALVVLDDFHSVDQAADAVTLLNMLVEESSDSVHFVVLSRSVPRLGLGRLRAQQRLCQMGEDDLAFTLSETALMLRDESLPELTDEQIVLVHERMEGWAAGIATVCQSLRYGRKEQVLGLLADRAGSARLVYEYLAQEVFDSLDDSTQDFLTKTSILTKMSYEACDWLLGTNTSLTTLLRLENGGLFTTVTEPGLHTFRYHPLFREFLRQKLDERSSPEAVRSLHRAAAAFHEACLDWEACVHHFIKAGQMVRAAEIVERVGERYICSGFSRTVEFWLQSLPEQIVSRRPWLLALRGRLAQMSGTPDESGRLLGRALELFAESGDQLGLVWASGELAYVECRSGSLSASVQRFEEAIATARPRSLLKGELLATEAMPLRLLGMLDRAVEQCRASLEELSGVEDETFRNWARYKATKNLALAQFERGDVYEAYATARHSLSLCKEQQLGEYEEAWSLAALGAIMWGTGDLKGAIANFERATDLSARHVSHQQQFLALWWGNCLRDSGLFQAAQDIYVNGTRPAEIERAFAGVLAGKGERLRTTAVDLCREAQQSEDPTERAAAEVLLAAVLRACGERRDALMHAVRAVGLLKPGGYRQRLASALMHKARLEYELGQEWSARESLSQAFKLAEASGYFQFYWWDPDMVALLCAHALAEDIFPDYTKELLVRRPDLPRGGIFSSLLESRQPRVRLRAVSALAALPEREEAWEANELLAGCGDSEIRHRLIGAINSGAIARHCPDLLHTRYGLSWREVDIFVAYYLRPDVQTSTPYPRWRELCASQLGLSENTVRCHITAIRRKLAVSGCLPRSANVFSWAAALGLLPPPAAMAGREGPQGRSLPGDGPLPFPRALGSAGTEGS